MPEQIDFDKNLPLTETTFFILLSLAPDAKHGYAIMKDVQSMSNNRVILSTGTLYGALKRLLKRDWIERVDRPDLDTTGRIRKAYRLTGSGARILDIEFARLQTLVSAAHPRLAGKQL